MLLKQKSQMMNWICSCRPSKSKPSCFASRTFWMQPSLSFAVTTWLAVLALNSMRWSLHSWTIPWDRLLFRNRLSVISSRWFSQAMVWALDPGFDLLHDLRELQEWDIIFPHDRHMIAILCSSPLRCFRLPWHGTFAAEYRMAVACILSKDLNLDYNEYFVVTILILTWLRTAQTMPCS
jgi:hypothetical protein